MPGRRPARPGRRVYQIHINQKRVAGADARRKKPVTSVYVPKDRSQSYPILFSRTPYSVAPYGEDNYRGALGPSEKFARELFIFVYQDVRGRYLSEGDYVNVTPQRAVKRAQETDESSDTWDTIDWLVKNLPNNNGKVGMWGISYPGFYTSAGLIDAHPALKAASPQAPIADWFIGDDFHHNGTLYLAHMFRFFASFGHPRPVPALPPPAGVQSTPLTGEDAYSFFLNMGPLTNVNEKFFKNDVPFWTEMTQHPAYDEYWKARDLRPHLKNIKPAVMTVGGWFDAEDLFGALNTYQTIE
jgi:putative CocE/NonD family hydrolase